MIYSLFWLTLISFFMNCVKLYILIITIMIIIIINVKCFMGKQVWGISIKQFSNINLLLWKKYVYYIQPRWYTSNLHKIYTIYLVLAKKMAQKWHFWQEVLRSTSKIWKPRHDWYQSEGINYVVMRDLNFWQILAEVLLELIRKKQ